MAKVYDIAFKLAGKITGDFSSTFKRGQETVARMGDSLATLNAKAAKLDGLVRARKAVAESAREYIQAKEKVADLGRAMSATKTPTAQMVSEFSKAKAALDKSKSALERNRSTLRDLDSQLGTTGTHLKTLVDRQNEIAKSADRARIAQQKLDKINEKLGKAQGAKDKLGEVRSSSTAALMGIGATVTATAGAPVMQAMSFEDQQAELRKFSDDYKEVFAGIQQLSLKYAKSTEDMTAMAANAFQSGIAKTGEEALKLVEIQNQMAIAFDMTGDEVGAAYADIQSKMGITIDQSKAMFDIVNQIGNTTSASAKDVVEVLARSGGALRGLTAMSEKQIAALAGSFRSASVSSEVASTSMMSFINALSSGEGATKGQKEAFKTLGIDAGKMAHMMTSNAENAQKAIQDVFKRINGLREDQKSSIIGALFGNEAGVKSAVATLAKQGDLLASNFSMIADESKYAGSMLKEYQSRADTTSNSVQIMGNAIKLVAGGVGTALLPVVRKSAEAFVASSEGVIKWVEDNQSLILTAMKVAGAVLGSVAAFHALRIAVSLLASPVISMYKGFLMAQRAIIILRNGTVLATVAAKAQAVATGVSTAAMKSWSLACKAAAVAQRVLNVALRAAPLAVFMGLLFGMVAAGVKLVQNWDAVKAKAAELWASFASKIPALASIAETAFSAVSGVVQTAKATFGELVDFVKNVFTGQWSAAWENVKTIFSTAFKSLSAVAKAPINGVIALVNGAISAMNGISVQIPEWVPGVGGQTFGVNLPQIPQLAEGGIATSSMLANIGEGGEPEAVVPLSKLPSLLGTAGGGFGGGISVNFAPVINVSGGSGDAYEGVKRGLDEGRRQFEKDFRRLMADQQRLSFA